MNWTELNQFISFPSLWTRLKRWKTRREENFQHVNFVKDRLHYLKEEDSEIFPNGPALYLAEEEKEM